MFEQSELDQIKRQYDAYTASKSQAQQQQPKKEKKGPGGIRGALLNFLPMAAGAAGTVLGGAAGSVLPGAGTAAGAVGGGALGSGLGEFLRQKLVGDETNVGGVAREAAFGALGGVGKGLQAIKTAKGTADASRTTAQSTEAALQARKGLLQKTGEKLSASGSGLKVGENVGDINTLGDQAQTVSKYRGTPTTQLKKMDADMKGLSQQVDDILSSTPIKVDGAMVGKRLQQASTDLTDERFVDLDLTNPSVQKIVGRYSEKFAQTQDAKGVNDIVKTLNKTATRATTKLANPNAAPLTAQETAALALKRAGDDVLGEVPEIAPLKQQMAQIFDINPQVAKTSEKGLALPFVGGVKLKAPVQAAKGVQSRVGAALQGSSSSDATTATSGFRPFLGQTARAAVPQAGVRAAGSVVAGTPFTPEPLISSPEPTETSQSQQVPSFEEFTASQTSESTSGGGIFSDPAKVEQAYAQALMAGNLKGADAILAGYELFGKSSKEKPMSAETSKVVANANSGLSSLEQLEQIMGGDPSARVKSAIPGRSLFGGAGAAALGTSSYDTAARNIADVITRLRTGAAITQNEEAFYKSQLPQAFDPPETVRQKMQMFRSLFSSVANRSGTAGTDAQAALGV